MGQEAVWDLKGMASPAARVAARKRAERPPRKDGQRPGSAWEAAVALLLAMDSCQLRADAVALGAAITSCERGSRWEEALQLLSFSKLDVVCCNAALSACENLGRHSATVLVVLVSL